MKAVSAAFKRQWVTGLLVIYIVAQQTLVKFNALTQHIHVLAGKIEEIDLPEKVDLIISEPMGYMLFNERMLETFLHAKKWLKPGGTWPIFLIT